MCPLASQIWEGSSFKPNFRVMRGCSELPTEVLDAEELGSFVAIAWECWNARNRFIFPKPDRNPSKLVKKAVTFVRSYWDMKTRVQGAGSNHPLRWGSLPSGLQKINSDGGMVGEEGWAGGSWIIIRDNDGNICMTGVLQGANFAGATIEEAQACLMSLQTARERNLLRVVVEGDCLPRVQKPQNKAIVYSSVGEEWG